ncbi:MAG: hypothetical protein EOO69_00605 [Moraxellaceae bacterium]|nr:MAG: hypothetical protein EOO69_00605 [Moraxellaceae bacterium]
MSYNFQSKNFKELFETPYGQELWNFLNTEASICRLQTASDLRKPALLGIEKHLLKAELIDPSSSVSHEDKALYDRTKQMLGAMVRQVLEHNGYEFETDNVRTPTSKIFKTASLYREAISNPN